MKHDSIVYDGFSPICAKYPWLVAKSPDEEEDGRIFYNLNDPLSKYQCRIPELLRKRIQGCFHGWLILSDHPYNNNLTLSLWNPDTSKIICLPPLILKDGDYESIGECCLSAPPADPRSVLLLTRTKKPNFVFLRLNCKRNKSRWIEMSYDKQLKRITSQDGFILQNLACCDGKVYALNTVIGFADFVIKIDILVKDRQVLINLSLLGPCPFSLFGNCRDLIYYLKGSGTELFFINVGFLDKTSKTPNDVSLYKLDMSSRKRAEMEVFKDLDMTDKDWMNTEDFSDLRKTRKMWEEMKDLKGAIFFVDVACDLSVYISSTISPEFGGYIHIRGKTGKIVYSYHVKNKTISISSMPSQVPPTSNICLWECWLVDGHGEAKCTIDFNKKEEDEGHEIVSVTDKERELNESQLLNLPFPILEMIIKLCVGVEYLKFRATCKLCYLAAPPIQRGKEYTDSLVSPWLMAVDVNQGILTFTDPICGGKYSMKNLHVLVIDGRIYYSKFGWLLFHSCDLDCPIFFNPFTNDLHKLPHPDCHLESVCFSAPPTSPDCMVVGFSNYSVGSVLIHFVARESSWRTLYVGSDPISIRFPTFIRQDLYALGNDGNLIVFKDLGEEDYSWKRFEAKAPRISCTSFAQYFMMKCDHHILLVVVGECIEPVEVFKWNNSIKEWEKVDGLGNHMIYICGITCICIEAKIPEMRNKIYFPRSNTKNENILFYSLESCRYHTSIGRSTKENFEDFIGTDYHFNTHMWIEPNWF